MLPWTPKDYVELCTELVKLGARKVTYLDFSAEFGPAPRTHAETPPGRMVPIEQETGAADAVCEPTPELYELGNALNAAVLEGDEGKIRAARDAYESALAEAVP